MNVRSKIACIALALGMALGVASFVHSVEAQDQPELPGYMLRVAYLQAAGLHLPSYMPGLMDLLNYQVSLPTHQELTVEWNLIPGIDHPVLREEFDDRSLAPNFTLLDRKHGIKGGVQRDTVLGNMALVSAAVTSTGEVRGLRLGPGTPLHVEEHLTRGNQTGGHDRVNPKETFVLTFPEDPKIEKVVFPLARPNGNEYRLEQVGTLQLREPSPPR